METQYIYDAKGNKTGIILPIELWDELIPLIKKIEKKDAFDPKKYRGIYRDLKIDFEDEIGRMRGEWTRI